jgi:hypothetical protein
MPRVRPETRFDDRDDALLASLREALQPERLPPTLAARIRADWHGRSAVGLRPRLGPFHLLGTAAAAALMITMLVQGGLGGRAAPSAPVVLSSDEAAAIVAAFGTTVWDSLADYSLAVVDASLDDLEGALRRETDDPTLLPWDSDDDWDALPAAEEGASRSRAPSRGLVLAGRGGDSRG